MIESDEILVKDNLCCCHMWGKVDVAQIHTILVNGEMCSILVPRWCHVEYLSVDLRIKTATLPEEQSRGMLNKQVFSIVYSVVQFDLDSRYFFWLCRNSNFWVIQVIVISWAATGGISLIFPSAFPSKGDFCKLFLPSFSPLLTFTLKSLYEQFITQERQVPWLSSHLGEQNDEMSSSIFHIFPYSW